MFSLSHRNRSFQFSSAITPSCVLLASVLLTSGCSQNPYLATPGSNVTWRAQGPGYAPGTAPPGVNPAVNPGMNANDARIAELNRRVQLLDDNNRQLHTQLAQSAQQSQVYKDELKVMRDQLAETTQRFESTRLAARSAQSQLQQAESQVRGMQASSQNRGGALIRANTNLRQLIGRLNLKGGPVQQDGDGIRIIVPADQLFQPGTAQLHQQATLTLDPIVAQLRSVFPRQRIGIEGYTDNAAAYGGQAGTSHQLASAQAAAVLDMLTRRGGMPMNQLFTVAQGSNNPRQPNNTASGRAANRRVELVVYPETF